MPRSLALLSCRPTFRTDTKGVSDTLSQDPQLDVEPEARPVRFHQPSKSGVLSSALPRALAGAGTRILSNSRLCASFLRISCHSSFDFPAKEGRRALPGIN